MGDHPCHVLKTLFSSRHSSPLSLLYFFLPHLLRHSFSLSDILRQFSFPEHYCGLHYKRMYSFYKNVGKVVKVRAETFAVCITASYAVVINYWQYIPAFNEQLFLYFLNIPNDYKTHTEKSNIRNSQK